MIVRADQAGLELARSRWLRAGTSIEEQRHGYAQLIPVRLTAGTVRLAVVEPVVWYASAGPLRHQEFQLTSTSNVFGLWQSNSTRVFGFDLPAAPDHTNLLRGALLKVFPDAKFISENKTDPDEGWTRPVLTVRTGMEDVRARIMCENVFYELIAQDEELGNALRAVTVLFD